MIALGGVVGAGLFVGSGAAILATGPAVLVSYAFDGLIVVLAMRMLGEMAVARPGLGSFHAHIGATLGAARPLHLGLAVLVLLDHRGWRRDDRRGEPAA